MSSISYTDVEWLLTVGLRDRTVAIGHGCRHCRRRPPCEAVRDWKRKESNMFGLVGCHGLHGLLVLSVGRSSMDIIVPRNNCSWAPLLTRADFAGWDCGFVYEPAPSTILPQRPWDLDFGSARCIFASARHRAITGDRRNHVLSPRCGTSSWMNILGHPESSWSSLRAKVIGNGGSIEHVQGTSVHSRPKKIEKLLARKRARD